MNEEKMSYGECLDEFDELQGQLQRLPSGDERAEIKRAVSDIRDLIIKADVQPKHEEEYVTRMAQILHNIKGNGDK